MTDSKPYKFLLALDGSIHARRAAQYLADRAVGLRPSEVVIVNALHGAPAPGRGPFNPDPLAVEVQAQLEQAGVPASIHVPLGEPAQKIIEAANEFKCDELVIGSRGAGALENFAIGSVAYKVAHLARQPVTVVPNPFASTELDIEDGVDAHRILLGVDGSKAALRAVDYVCRLQARVPLTVHLLNVQPPIVSRQVSRYVAKASMDAFLQEEGREALAAASTALRAAGLDTEDLVRIGQVARTIVKESALLGCTRIVLGGRGLNALAGMVLGSTALQVMHMSELPVTLVK